MAIYGFDGFVPVLPKIFRAIFYLFYDVTGPNGYFPTWGGEKCSLRKIRCLEAGGAFYRIPLSIGSEAPAKRIRSIQVQTASCLRRSVSCTGRCGVARNEILGRQNRGYRGQIPFNFRS
jgi:hypothetical protein